MTFKERKLWCGKCKNYANKLLWDTDPIPRCESCGGEREAYYGQNQKAPAVIGDEIDIMIPHGICYPDGRPKRYTSKADIRVALKAAGLRERVEHVPARGSDKSKHTVRWV